MKVQNVVKAVLFCTMALVVYLYIYRVLSWKDTGGDYRSTMDTFYQLEDNMVDVLFLGSSHCYCSVNAALLWEQYGMAAYSLSISGQDLASSYYCMKEALKTQKPKVVCVEMYYSALQGYAVKGNLYRNLLGYKPSKNFADAVNSIAEEEEKWDILLKWPIIHTRYAELTKKDFRPDAEMRFYMGYETEYGGVNNIGSIPVYSGEDSVPIAEETEQWLHNIIALAEASGVELCFFLAPFQADEWTQRQYQYVTELAEAAKVPFLNMILLQEELSLDYARDFSDWAHTNPYGSKKITAYLGEYLTEHYELADKRGDRQYVLWDESLRMWKHLEQNQAMREITVLGDYLDRIAHMQGYTAIVATRGEYLTDNPEDLAERLSYVGIGEEFFQREGVWVIENGTIRYEAQREGCFQHMEIGESDLMVHGNDGQIHVIIDRQDYMKANQGIDIILYDNVLERVVDVVGFQAAESYISVR